MVVTLKLSPAQDRFFKDDIRVGRTLGDCRDVGLKIVMDDYEGAQAMLGRFLRRKTNSTREYVTWNAVIDKLNAAIVLAAAGARG